MSTKVSDEKQSTKADFEAAMIQAAIVSGHKDSIVCVQAFHDRDKNRPDLARFKHGRLSDPSLRKWAVHKQSQGCGIYISASETDGAGRQRKNILHARYVYADLDGAPLPDFFPIKPHLIVETSSGRYQPGWAIVPTANFDAFSGLQARLAEYYKGDPSVTGAERVIRLAGFDHQKKKPFRSRIIYSVDPTEVVDDGFSRLTIEELADAHPVEFKAPSQPSEASRIRVPEGGWDDESDVIRATDLVMRAEPAIEDDHGDDRTYQLACQLYDLGISEGKALDLMAEHFNPRCEPPWPDDVLKVKIRNAYKYAQNPAGVSSSASDQPDEPSEGDYELNAVNPRRINWQFAVVNINGKVRIMHWGRSPIHANVRVPEFMTQDDFRLAIKNKDVPIKDKKSIPLAEHWLSSSERKTYDGFALDPNTQDNFVGGKVNLWRGFSVIPEQGGWSLMQKHILEVMADGNPEYALYITKWVAWAYQNPEKQAEVALVFLGGKGTGKGFFARPICETFGVHGIHLSDRKHVTGHFNSHYMQCALVYSDEAIWPGHKEDDATIKRMLTEPTLFIEPKGINAFALPNHLKVIMTGNDSWVVPASADERRYAVFRVSDKHKQDSDYFAALKNEIENGGKAAMLHDLLQLDLVSWHPRDGIPQTEALTEQKMLSAPVEVLWLSGILEDGILPGVHPKRPDWARASELYIHARQSLPALKHWSDVKLSKFLTDEGFHKQTSNGVWWCFPPLSEARAALIQKYKWGSDSGPKDWGYELRDFDE